MMIRSLKKRTWQLLGIMKLDGLLQLSLNGYLKEKGWFKSFTLKKSVDKNGNLIPWLTYPCVHFITTRIKTHFDVFEFGSGASTAWFATRVNSIHSIEHDQKWYQQVRSTLPDNAKVEFVELVYGGDYAKSIHRQHKKYHIVIVDGRDRNNCLFESVQALTDDGIIILDNSNLENYKQGIEFIKKEGFRSIEFEGMSPGSQILTCTSVFYKSNNCLNI